MDEVSGCMDSNANWNSASGGEIFNDLANVDCNGNVPPALTNGDTSCCGYQACWQSTNPNTTAPHINYACNTGLLPDLSYLCSNGIPDTNLGVFNIANSNGTPDLSLCTQEILGCTDANAFNYNPSANVDDNSCIAVVYGCMDLNANNYDAAANINAISVSDSSDPCTYDYGCTYPGSTNYDPDHTMDDPSDPCFYDGCVDDGSQYTALLYPNWTAGNSPWNNYVCVNPDAWHQTDITALNPFSGNIETNKRAEWLCHCGPNFSNACDLSSNPITGTYATNLTVEFKDSGGGVYALSTPTDTDSYNAFDPAGPFGSCTGN